MAKSRNGSTTTRNDPPVSGNETALTRNDDPQVSLGSNAPSAPAAPQFAATLDAEMREPTTELGGTGLKGAEPYGGFLWEEFLPRLRGLQGARQFKEMADNDPMCGGILYALTTLMRSVVWRVEPKDTRPESIVAAERIQAALFDDMEHPFGQLIDEACSMLTFGYSPHEIIFKRCQGETDDPLTSSTFSDGLMMPASIPIRSQETIWRWIMDVDGRGRILGYEQYRIGSQNAAIPIQKSLLFRTESKRNNPEGRSVLRNAFVPYIRKKTIEEAEGRLAVRSAGIVVARIPAKFMEIGLTGTDRATFNYYKSMADTLAQDRNGSVVLPSDKDDKGNTLYDLSFLVADSRNVKDFTPIIDRHDVRIAVSVLADFLLLGTKNVGSFALADSKTSLFVISVDGYLSVIAEQINKVLLRKVWRLNGLDPTTIPTVKPGNVQQPDLEKLGAFLQSITAAGAPIFPSVDSALENRLLSMAGLPTGEQKEG